MQKHNLLFIFLLAAAAVQAQTSAKKYVFIEHFTNSNCSNCGSKNPAFYTLINQYPNDIHHVSIHPPIPYATCALYQSNPVANNARRFYYGVFGTPSVALNGELQPVSTPLLSATTLQNYLGETSPLWLEVSESGPNNARVATVKAHSLSAIPSGNYKLYVALVEKTVNYQGTNTETVHHDVMRKLLPDTAATVFTPAAVGQSVQFNFNYTLNAGANPAGFFVVAWVQNTATKAVLNSGTRFDPLVVGTDEPDLQTAQIQPNPVRDIAFARIGDDRAESVEVFAANGQRVSVTFENEEIGQVSIPTAPLAPGIYFVKITGEKGVYTAKMLKE